jgi:hypothetical protein
MKAPCLPSIQCASSRDKLCHEKASPMLAMDVITPAMNGISVPRPAMLHWPRLSIACKGIVLGPQRSGTTPPSFTHDQADTIEHLRARAIITSVQTNKPTFFLDSSCPRSHSGCSTQWHRLTVQPRSSPTRPHHPHHVHHEPVPGYKRAPEPSPHSISHSQQLTPHPLLAQRRRDVSLAAARRRE